MRSVEGREVKGEGGREGESLDSTAGRREKESEVNKKMAAKPSLSDSTSAEPQPQILLVNFKKFYG